MLGRRILRIKVFKTIYSFAENPGMSLADAKSQLKASCESTRDLYLFLLSIVGPLTAEAESRIEAARSKFNPSEEEKNPNLKFVHNRIAPLLGEDPDFEKALKRRKISWDQYDAFLRHLYETIREREYFRKYMESGESSLKEDAALFCRIFENELSVNPELQEIMEDLSIFWNDDLSYAAFRCSRSIQELGNGKRWSLPPLYMSDMEEGREDDEKFVNKLLECSFSGYDRICSSVSDNTPKWNRDRLCTTDLSLIACGVAESEAFPLTSPGIIINEYVEISKFYSTPESSSFVNGLLDKLINKTK